MDNSQNPNNNSANEGNVDNGGQPWQGNTTFNHMNDNTGQFYIPTPNFWQYPQIVTQQDINRLQRYTDDNFNILHKYIDVIAKKIENLDDKLNIILQQIKTGQNTQNKNTYNNNRFQKQNKQFQPKRTEIKPKNENIPTNENIIPDKLFFESIFKTVLPTDPNKSKTSDKTDNKSQPPGFDQDSNKPEVIIHIADLDANKSKSSSNNLNDPLTNILGPLLFNTAFNQKSKSKPKNKTDNNIESDDEYEEPIEYSNDDIFEELNVEANTINDLIKLGDMYDMINKEKKEQIINNKKDEDTDTDTDHDNDKSLNPLKNQSLNDNNNGNNNKNTESPKKNNDDKSQNKSGDEQKNKQRDDLIDKMLKSKKIIKPPSVSPSIKTPKSVTKTKKINSSIYEFNGKKYSINIETLHKLKKPLEKLQSLVGLQSVKDAIVDMILYYVQGFENRTNNMLHTIIEGPPGVGKTEIGKILAEIYAGLGVIPSSKFKLIKRTDLVGEYLGHTAKITQQVFDEADGGVLFIDEAYSLGNEEKRDSFSKECIDTINQNLSEKKRNLIVIIAGYPDQLEKCFFSYNPGLKRRFPFKYTIEGYQPTELCDIFIKKIRDSKWKLSEEDLDVESLIKFFTENKDNFPNFGGDIDNLLVNCKFMHSRRLVGKHPKYRFKLAKLDIDNGLARFVKNKGKTDANSSYLTMYS